MPVESSSHSVPWNVRRRVLDEEDTDFSPFDARGS